MQRQMSVSGAFYPSTAVELERYFDHFSREYDHVSLLPDVKTKAVIVPHAGYIYSGYTANIAYRVLQKSALKTFVVIGPSHRVAFDGVSLCSFSSYATPFAPIPAAAELAQSLKELFALPCHLQAHAEHSTEVQFPFIKHYMQDASVVELVYSYVDAHLLSQIIDFLLKKEDVGVIISTDLSHFYTLQEASKLDALCVEAIQKLDIGLLHSGCEACGHIGVEAMLLSAKKFGMRPHILDYRTSADASDDRSRVVGYVSALFA